MADDAVREIVAKLKLDVSDWGDAVKEARTVLVDADEEDKGRQASSKAASSEAIAAIKEQVASQELLKASAQAQAEAERAKAESARTQAAQAKSAADITISASQQIAANERAKEAATQAAAAVSKTASDQTLAATRVQAAASASAHAQKMADMQQENAILAKEIAERQLNIKKIQEEVAETRAKVLEEHNAAREEKESHGLGSLLGGSATVLAGGKGSLGGGLIGGLLGGFAGVAVFETLEEGLTKLTEKIKEFVEDSGGLQKVLETFQKLNEMKFGDNGLEFLDQLEEKTQHLVTETDLLRTANTFLGSSLKISKQQMLELTEATVGLARGRGLDATQAMKALDRVFLSGGRGIQQFSRLIGIQLPRNVGASLGPLATYTEKAQAQFSALSKSVEALYKSIGAPALTYTDRLKQVSNASTEIFESLAQGAVHSTGFQLISDEIGKLIDHLGDAQKVAYEFGTAIGNAVTPAIAIVKSFLPVLSLIKDAFVETTFTVSSLLGSIESIGSEHPTDRIAENFARLHPIVNMLAKSFAILAGLIADTMNGLETALSIANKIKDLTPTPGVGSEEYAKFRQEHGAKPLPPSINFKSAEKMEAASWEKTPGTFDESVSYNAFKKQYEKQAAQEVPGTNSKEYGDYLQDKLAKENKANEELYKNKKKSLEDYTNEKKRLEEESKRGLTHGAKVVDYEAFAKDYKQQHPLVGSKSQSFAQIFDAAQGRANVARQTYESADKLGSDYDKAQKESQKLLDSFKNKSLKLDTSDPMAARREQLAEQRANLQAIKKLADENFAATKQQIAEETEANEELYKAGGASAEKYYSTKKRLAQETYDATIAHINAETEATLQGNRDKLKANEISPKTFTIEYITAMRQQQTQKINAQSTLNKTVSGADIGENAEFSREQIELINTQLDVRKAELAQETTEVKSAYAEQLISGKDYFATLLDIAQKNADAIIDAEKAKQNTGLKPEQLEASLKTEQKAYEDHYKALQQLDDHYAQEQIANTQKRFSNILSVLTSTQAINENEGGNAAAPSVQLANLQQQRDATDAQIQSLEALLATTKQYSDTWFQIYDAILAATKQTQTLSDQMLQLSTYSSAAGNVLSSFAKNTQNVFTSRYGRGFVSAIAGAGESLSTSQQQIKAIFGKKTPEVDKLQPYIDATKEATAGIITSAKDSSSGLDTFSSSIKSAKDVLVDALNDLASKIKSVVFPQQNTSGVTQSGIGTSLAFSPSAITSSTPAVPVVASPSVAATPPTNYVEAPKTPTIPEPEGNLNIFNGITESKNTFTEAIDEFSSKIRSVVAPQSTLAVANVIPPTVKDTGLSSNQSNLQVNPVASENTTAPDSGIATATQTAGSSLIDFSKKMTNAIGAIGGFISSISSAGSASAGAFGGGVSGAGLGQAAGTSLGQNGGPLSSMGQFAGPFGALIGAGIGAALGGIMGQKQEEVVQDINQLNVSYKAIMSAYSSNNASLQKTIQNIQALIAQAEQDQANTKKGGSQFADLIRQYNEQIQQLQDQASQTMAQLQQQLAVITSPVPYQSLLSSVQQIIQQYSQFAGAAQNATDLANANQFLTSSLQNLGQSYTDTLRTDEENAIADALNLNNLYTQRNQLQLQFLQSTEQIMGQGTLTRQITQSQSKFSQLYTLDVNHQNQLDILNQQINVAQYKVTAEQQIFNLATTKAGLEQQTLILQEQGINLDMARISAMQTLLTTLQSTGFSITDLTGVSSSDPNALMNMLLQLLITQLTNTGALSGYTAPNGQNSLLDSLVASTYASRAQYGYGGFRSTNL